MATNYYPRFFLSAQNRPILYFPMMQDINTSGIDIMDKPVHIVRIEYRNTGKVDKDGLHIYDREA